MLKRSILTKMVMLDPWVIPDKPKEKLPSSNSRLLKKIKSNIAINNESPKLNMTHAESLKSWNTIRESEHININDVIEILKGAAKGKDRALAQSIMRSLHDKRIQPSQPLIRSLREVFVQSGDTEAASLLLKVLAPPPTRRLNVESFQSVSVHRAEYNSNLTWSTIIAQQGGGLSGAPTGTVR